jgi:hypothetical protein
MRLLLSTADSSQVLFITAGAGITIGAALYQT